MGVTVQVHIWGWSGLGIGWGRVGHVMVVDAASGNALLSQFPHEPGQATCPRGYNILFTYGQTYDNEGSPADVIFELQIEDASVPAFQSQCQNEVNRPTWDWDPTPPEETHCARSSYDAIMAGGIPIDPTGEYTITDGETNEILPNSLWHLLEKAGFTPKPRANQNLVRGDIKDLEFQIARTRRLDKATELKWTPLSQRSFAGRCFRTVEKWLLAQF